MSVFKQTWLEVIERMRPEDVPSDTAFRDTLHSKIKESLVYRPTRYVGELLMRTGAA